MDEQMKRELFNLLHQAADDEFSDLIYRLDVANRESLVLKQVRAMLADAVGATDLAGVVDRLEKVTAFIKAASEETKPDKKSAKSFIESHLFKTLSANMVG